MSDDDEIKDDKHDDEAEESETEAGSETEEHGPEADFASSNAAIAPSFDDAGDDLESDPHDAFNAHSSEDPHAEDVYGDAGAPRGFGGEDEEDDMYGEGGEEDMDGFTEDSDAY